MQSISVKTRGYRHNYHPTLLSIELLLQLQTIVTNVLRLPYFDNYLTKLAISTFFTIYSKMAQEQGEHDIYIAAIAAKKSKSDYQFNFF